MKRKEQNSSFHDGKPEENAHNYAIKLIEKLQEPERKENPLKNK